MNSSFLSALRQLMSFPKARGCPVGPSFVAASVEAVHWNGPLLTGPCPLPPISGGHVFAPLPSVSSFTSLEACMCSFQPGCFTSATLLAGRDPDGEQVACVFVSSGPSTVPDTPVSGECSNKDCQCECQRRRRRHGEEGVHLSSGLCISLELVAAPWLKAGRAREPIGGEPPRSAVHSMTLLLCLDQ